ncbi:GNAT family N-acetyltransferase [Vibrio lentus]
MNTTFMRHLLSANKLSLITISIEGVCLAFYCFASQEVTKEKEIKVRIRRATINDISSINALCHEQLAGSHSKIRHYNREQNEYSLNDYNLSNLRIIDLLFTESLMKEKIENKNIYFFVAETKKKQIVGYLIISVHYPKKKPVIQQRAPSFYAYIERFYVSCQYHGQGIELALLNSFDYWKKHKSTH